MGWPPFTPPAAVKRHLWQGGWELARRRCVPRHTAQGRACGHEPLLLETRGRGAGNAGRACPKGGTPQSPTKVVHKYEQPHALPPEHTVSGTPQASWRGQGPEHKAHSKLLRVVLLALTKCDSKAGTKSSTSCQAPVHLRPALGTGCTTSRTRELGRATVRLPAKSHSPSSDLRGRASPRPWETQRAHTIAHRYMIHTGMHTHTRTHTHARPTSRQTPL